MPSKIAATGLKMCGALVPTIAAPAKVPYIKSLVLILPFMTADMASEVTTDALIAQYALIMPFWSRKGAVLVFVVATKSGVS